MVVLDTDHLSLLMWKSGKESRHLQARLDEMDLKELVTTIITYEEQTRDWLGFSSRSRTPAQLVDSYGRLKRHLDGFRRLTVLEFDQAASAIYRELKGSRLRVGTMDLKIASIVLSKDATLLTRNLIDFRKVPGLKSEDWTS